MKHTHKATKKKMGKSKPKVKTAILKIRTKTGVRKVKKIGKKHI